MDEQINKLRILRKEGIENYKELQKAYTNGNNGLTLVETSLVESVQDSDMN